MVLPIDEQVRRGPATRMLEKGIDIARRKMVWEKTIGTKFKHERQVEHDGAASPSIVPKEER